MVCSGCAAGLRTTCPVSSHIPPAKVSYSLRPQKSRQVQLLLPALRTVSASLMMKGFLMLSCWIDAGIFAAP
jgi:hypothetical protein